MMFFCFHCSDMFNAQTVHLSGLEKAFSKQGNDISLDM
jgi:hypothetical protein